MSRDRKKCNKVIILSFDEERHCFTTYQVFNPIHEGPKNDLIEPPPFVNTQCIEFNIYKMKVYICLYDNVCFRMEMVGVELFILLVYILNNWNMHGLRPHPHLKFRKTPEGTRGFKIKRRVIIYITNCAIPSIIRSFHLHIQLVSSNFNSFPRFTYFPFTQIACIASYCEIWIYLVGVNTKFTTWQLCKSKERIAIRENELCKLRERITIPWEKTLTSR